MHLVEIVHGTMHSSSAGQGSPRAPVDTVAKHHDARVLSRDQCKRVRDWASGWLPGVGVELVEGVGETIGCGVGPVPVADAGYRGGYVIFEINSQLVHDARRVVVEVGAGRVELLLHRLQLGVVALSRI